MTQQSKSYLYALATILCWSTIATAFKISLEHLDFYQLLFFASFVATIVHFILLIIQNKLSLIKRITLKDLGWSFFLGLLNPFLYYLVLLKAYSLLKAQEAGTLNYIWPITLVLLSIPMLKQKIRWISILAIIVSFVGIIIISTEGKINSFEFREPVGVVLALLSSIFWSLYWIYNIKDKRDENIKLFMNFLAGTFFSFIAVVIFSDFNIFQFKGIAGATYLGLFEMGIPFFLWLKALKLSENTAKVANLIYLSPFISLIIIQIVLKEQIIPATIIGLAFIVGGILLQQFTAKKSIN